MSRYRFIAAERGHYPVRRLCLVLGVPASGFYAWQTTQQRAAEPQTPAWETALVKVFGVHKRRYGTRRFQVVLGQKGHRVGRQRLRTLAQPPMLPTTINPSCTPVSASDSVYCSPISSSN